MRPFDLVLLDSRRCYEFNFPVHGDDAVAGDADLLGGNRGYRIPMRRIGQRIDGRAGWGAALSAFACQLTPQLAVERPLQAQVLHR